MEEERKQFEAKLKKLRKELKNTKDQLRRVKTVPPTVLAELMMVRASTHGSMDLAMEFLLTRRRNLSARREEIRECLTQKWESTDEIERTRLRQGPYLEKELTTCRSVNRWLKERALHGWVETQNLTKGIAPMHSMVMTHVNNSTNVTEPSAVTGPVGRHRIRRKWLYRWRLRWNVTVASLKPGDVLPPEVAQRKVLWANES